MSENEGGRHKKKVSIWVIETLAFIRRCRTGEKISDSILCYSEAAFSFKKKNYRSSLINVC